MGDGTEQTRQAAAEAHAWARKIDDAYIEASTWPCSCITDEPNCPHCNAWERARTETFNIIQRIQAGDEP